MLEPGQTIGSYEVIEQLGGGGCSTVWQVKHVHLGSHHALKVLRDELVVRKDIRQRFLDEGRIHAQLRHPGIVRATDIVVEPGLAALVMDYLEGQSLGECLAERDQPLLPGSIRRIASQLLSALHFVHQRGIVHRDIKPTNVILSPGWDGVIRPVLLDFGIAQVRGELRSGQREGTQVGLKMGTPGYMSPEQLRSASDVDPRSDLFSVGVLLLEMATLVSPFERDSEVDTMAAVISGDYSLPEELLEHDPALAEVIATALRIQRDDRWPSARAMADALTASEDAELPAEATPAPPTEALTDTLVPKKRGEDAGIVAVLQAVETYRPTGALSLALKKLALAADGTPSLGVAPDFDGEKLFQGLRSYCPEPDGPVLVHFDSTVFGGAKEGFILTPTSIYSKASFQEPLRVQIPDVLSVDVPAGKSTVKLQCRVVGDGEEREAVIKEDLGSVAAALRLADVLALLR